MEVTRVDRWLWAVRVYKTRSAATDACRGNHIRVNGVVAKPATPVRAGDRVSARVNGWDRDLEVVHLVATRVAASVALTCLVDHSPPAPRRDPAGGAVRRDPASGRPTKKDRRRLDHLRSR